MVADFLPSQNRSWKHVHHGETTAWATGCAFRGQVLLQAAALAALTAEQIDSSESLRSLMQELSGQFALVVRCDEGLLLGGDIIRSVPVFYRADGTAASDDIALLSPGKLNYDSVAEFAAAGFVTGSYTLYDGIRTLEAGEVVCLGADGIEAQTYYDLRNNYSNDNEDKALLAAMDETVMACMGRAAEICAGRQVVIPLSGGLDSRLLATSFKRLGYENIICFAYGLPGNHEAVKSKQVAEALGLSWFEVPYDPEELRRDFQSEAMARFQAFAGQGHTMPTLTEWSAVRLVCEQGLVDDDAVFLSGQSGDFINGSHLKYLIDPEWNADSRDVVGAIGSKHYSLWGGLLEKPLVGEAVGRRVQEIVGRFEVHGLEQAAEAYEYWECRERQLKYVVQGGRIFEFFGHDWWMPLWDRELIDFFKPISIGLKMKGYLYAKYLAAHDPYGVFQEDRPVERFNRDAVLAEAVRRMTPRRKLKNALTELPGIRQWGYRNAQIRKHRHAYRHSPLGFAHMYAEQQYVREDLEKRHELSLWLRDHLEEHYGVRIADLERLLSGEVGA